VNTLLELPAGARGLLVLAHGAGAGMRHPFMEAMARALAARGIGTLRYEFPYMEAKGRRPDPPAVATARVREAVAEASRLAPGVPLLAGGKSFGGRMTSTAQAEAPLEGVRGLVFLGFPLHPPGRPGIERAAHLADVQVPVLFLQGTRDEFATRSLLEPVVAALGARATLRWVEQGDHSFKAPRRSGLDADGVMALLADATTDWIHTLLR
jgi:predicted alpha/beta-hydrolase family hydrolase